MTSALIFVALMLVIGVIVRQLVPALRFFFIPASVLAGAVGLLVIQVGKRAGPAAGEEFWAGTLSDQLSSWPGWLIAVVFAGLLLERRSGSGGGTRARHTLSQILMVWIIVLGQTAVGLLLTWLVVQPIESVPNSFGMLIETGFAGGHGTAGAMGAVFAHPSIDLQDGLALGTMMATVGLVYGIVSGIGWINLAARLGWVRRADVSAAIASSTGVNADDEQNDSETASEVAVANQPSPLGFEIVDREIIDPLLLQMMWLALAFGIGWGLHAAVGQLSGALDRPATVAADATEPPESRRGDDAAANATVNASSAAADAELRKRLSWSAVLGGFPLFIYTLLGGWLVRWGLTFVGYAHLIDTLLLKHLSAVAMDVLVVAAMASLNLDAVASMLLPLSVLLLGGFVWTGICLMVLSRRILPASHWFQLGLINYGMSTGTTATGFVLLRVVDPQLDTDAAEDYALAAPFSAPFIGGGMITVGLPLLVLENVPIAISAFVCSVLVVGLVFAAIRLRRRLKLGSDAGFGIGGL